VKTKTRSAKRPAKTSSTRPRDRSARGNAGKRAKGKRGPAKPASAKPASAKRAKRASAKRAKRVPARRRAAVAGRPASSPWLRFVEQHGVVLASARGPVPSIAEAVAGEPIVGSWWAHPKGKAIFAALSEIDDAFDVRCFKLIDGKVTFVHRRMWPALVRLTKDGVITAERAASLQQEHMPTGEHRNIITPFPEWVPDEVAAAADRISADEAKAQLGTWVG